MILDTHPAWPRISTTQEVYVLLTPILRASVYISACGTDGGPETKLCELMSSPGLVAGSMMKLELGKLPLATRACLQTASDCDRRHDSQEFPGR